MSCPILFIAYCFSISRSNAAGYPLPFSNEVESVTAGTHIERAIVPDRIELTVYPNPFNRDAVLE